MAPAAAALWGGWAGLAAVPATRGTGSGEGGGTWRRRRLRGCGCAAALAAPLSGEKMMRNVERGVEEDLEEMERKVDLPRHGHGACQYVNEGRGRGWGWV